MATPLADRDALDIEGLERLVAHILSAPVSGLFLLGTTGEGPSLSYHLRRELVDRVCSQVDGRVPVLVGVTDTSFIESINVAEDAADAGADAVVLSAPYYFAPDQQNLWQYIEAINDELPLPLYLYNMPGNTKVSFAPDTVRRALQLPNIVGIKDSSGDMRYFDRLRRVVAQRSDFSLLIGPEELLGEAVLLGAHGGVSGGANLAPQLYVDLYHAAADGDIQRTKQLQSQVVDLASSIYRVTASGASVIQGIKTALSLLGICNDLPAEPFHRLVSSERRQIEQAVDRLNLHEAVQSLP